MTATFLDSSFMPVVVNAFCFVIGLFVGRRIR